MSKNKHKWRGTNDAPSEENRDINPATELTREMIQERAYAIYLEKGGSDLDNWLEAERLLKEEQDLENLKSREYR